MALGNPSFEDCETFGSLFGRISRPRLLAGDVGEHLVHIHVRGGTRSGLEDVDRELVLVSARCHLVCSRLEGSRHLRVDHAELGVDRGRGTLDERQGSDQRGIHALAGDGEVLHRTLGLRAPLGASGDLDYRPSSRARRENPPSAVRPIYTRL